jgi:hypothetical protein
MPNSVYEDITDSYDIYTICPGCDVEINEIICMENIWGWRRSYCDTDGNCMDYIEENITDSEVVEYSCPECGHCENDPYSFSRELTRSEYNELMGIDEEPPPVKKKPEVLVFFNKEAVDDIQE